MVVFKVAYPILRNNKDYWCITKKIGPTHQSVKSQDAQRHDFIIYSINMLDNWSYSMSFLSNLLLVRVCLSRASLVFIWYCHCCCIDPERIEFSGLNFEFRPRQNCNLIPLWGSFPPISTEFFGGFSCISHSAVCRSKNVIKHESLTTAKSAFWHGSNPTAWNAKFKTLRF